MTDFDSALENDHRDAEGCDREGTGYTFVCDPETCYAFTHQLLRIFRKQLNKIPVEPVSGAIPAVTPRRPRAAPG